MKTIKRLKPYLKGSGWLFALSLLCAFLATGSKLAIPFFAGRAVNKIIDPSSSSMEFGDYLIVMSVCLAVGTIFRYVFDYLTAMIGQRVILKIRTAVFKSYNDAPLSYIDQCRKGDMISRLINDVENIQAGLVSGFAALYDGVVAICFTLVFMFTLNWLLAVIVVVLTPISIVVSKLVSNFNSTNFKAQAKDAGILTSFALEGVNNSEAVATLNISQKREEEFDKLNQSFRNAVFKANLGSSLINPSTRLVNAIINGVLIAVGAILVINSKNTVDPFNYGVSVFMIGDLSAFLTYAASYMTPFNEISNVITEISYATSSLKRVDDVVNAPKDVNDGSKAIDGEVDNLKAEHVTFSYDGKRTIIKDLDLEIFKGHKVAFVGPTGCGKTTLINLLMRFYDPQEGNFSANGYSTIELEKRAFRNHIGMVLQDTWIFHGTVFENIAYSKPEATLEEVKSAAEKAQASSFIERLPKGYDTYISDSSGLSIGEKQLICVARVMLMEPEIVILDEATSNIDVRTEALLSESFNALMKGKTSLVVAHRLSTIKSSDLIVVLKDGEIIEMGNHNELMEKGGFYNSLYNSQFN
ncbi:MAG: ABC transporter ATP-binding protein/permease [Bacilli bacterium]|nr:ABC transporter ATP-binding protein/permease [Bacilli bacterium]